MLRSPALLVLPTVLVGATSCDIAANFFAPDLDDEAVATIAQQLSAEYTRHELAGVRGGTPTSDQVQNLENAGDVTLHDVDMVYNKRKEAYVVRVSPRVAGGPPPDGRMERYFLMKHSVMSGWRLKREVSATWFRRSWF